MISLIADSLFKQLADLSLTIEGRKIPIIATLKQLPRTGKSLRIQKHRLNLPKRSVYDHIRSLPQIAEFSLALSKADLDPHLLAALLVFHDLSEAVIGDTPSFTDLEGHSFLTAKALDEAEQITNAMLLEAMPHPLKPSFTQFLALHQEKSDPLYRFFYQIDKIDPIIAIWRYLFLFRGKIPIETFLSAMSDFFLNPEPQRTCLNSTTLSVVHHLQNPENAKNFYHNPTHYFHNFFAAPLADPLHVLLETRGMHFVNY